MKKGILTVFALFLLGAVLLAAPKADAATSGTCGENVTWTLDDEGILTISGTGLLAAPMVDSWWGEFADPAWESNRQAVKKVVINEGITAIGDNAFRAFYNLESIEIPASVTEIYWDFARDSGVKTITFKGTCPKLNVSEHHDNCGDWQCDGGSCGSLCGISATVYYPAGDPSYESAMGLEFCTAITWQPSTSATVVASGTCGDNLTWTLDDQGTLTISGTGAMKNWTSGSSVPWYSNRYSIEKVVIGNSVTTIGVFAFRNCIGLKSVTIGNSVTTIGKFAFYYCTGLTSVTIPDSVTTIGSSAFTDTAWYNNQPDGLVYAGKVAYKYKGTCPATVTIKDGTLGITGTAFYNCDGLASVTIPDSVTAIGDEAFYSCDGLTSVTIGNSVTTIGEFAFSRCYGLTSVTIGNSVTTIGTYAFSYCYGLTSVTIGNSVTTIGTYAFSYCTGLTSVTIGNSVTTIGGSAFCSCDDLTHVAYTGTQSQWGKISIEDKNEKLTGATRHYEISFQNLDNCVESRVYCPVCEQVIVSTVKDGGAHSFEAVVTAPTCTQAGSTTKTCTVCGETEIEKIAATGHSYENGSCTVCGAAQPDEKFDIDVARMILGNALEFQFGVEKNAQTSWIGAYAVIEKSWADGTTTEKTIPFDQWGTAGQYYAIVYDGLAAKEMGDVFNVTIYNADGKAISNPKTDSARDYVARAFDSQPDTGKTMMVDMLNYGAAAQLQFGYNTANLANNGLTEAQKAYATQDAPAMGNYQFKGSKYLGTRFVLQSRIQVQVAFEGLTSDMYAIYNYTDASGKTQSVRVEGKDFITAGDKKGIELSQLVYADARGLVTVMVYNADGTLHGMAIDSIESCAYRSKGVVFAALMKFADSAKKHLYS